MTKAKYTPVRDGILDHHAKMSFVEIAVFHHLLNRAIRSPDLADRLDVSVGFCVGMNGNRLAREMGKARSTIHRALTALECHPKTKRRYISRFPDGILIHNFQGDGAIEVDEEREQAPKQSQKQSAESRKWSGESQKQSAEIAANEDPSPGNGPLVSQKQSASGPYLGLIKNSKRKRETNDQTTSDRQLTLSRERASPVEESRSPPNPHGFVAYWRDANEYRDFSLRFEPEDGFWRFVRDEGARHRWARSPPELEAFVRGTLAKFVATYSKRSGKKRRTRGSAISPQQLTEELVGWIRQDLGEQAKRDATRFKSQAERVDDSVKRLAENNYEEKWKRREIEDVKPSGALSGLLRER